MKVAGVQHDIVWEDPEANFARFGPMITEAARQGARLVVLTEMFATGFSMDAERISEEATGPTVRFLVEQAASSGVWVGASFPEKGAAGERPSNRFLVAAPDGAVHGYSKIHPFRYGREDEHYRAGTDTLTLDIEGVRVTPFVCYDLRFADVFWRTAGETDLYVVVANWPAARADHWSTLLRARAIENQAYVVGVNRVGTGGGLDYGGASVIVGPWGDVLADAGDREGIIIANVDPACVTETRARYPFLADR